MLRESGYIKDSETRNTGQANSIYYPESRFDLSRTAFHGRINGSATALRGESGIQSRYIGIDIDTKASRAFFRDRSRETNFPVCGKSSTISDYSSPV